MFKHLENVIRRHVPYDDENTKIGIILKDIDKDARVLEVGCGYGNKIRLLESLGFSSIKGVEISPKIASQAAKQGINVVSVEEFWEKCDESSFDLVLMSHIIEHFQWQGLLEFLDRYLSLLRKGGYLLLVTPISHGLFYNDFDHVKPYYPHSINSVFGNEDSQVQMHSNNHLRLEKIYFRRAQLRLKFYRSLYTKSRLQIPSAVNVLLALLFRISFGAIGNKTGWVGLYRKT